MNLLFVITCFEVNAFSKHNMRDWGNRYIFAEIRRQYAEWIFLDRDQENVILRSYS